MSRQSELAELSRVYDSSALSNRNLIINGGMTVAQRGTSFTGQEYTLDRFYQLESGATATTTQETFALGSELEGLTKYLKQAVSTGNDYCGIIHKVEDVKSLPQGKATLSFYAKGTNPAAGSFQVVVIRMHDGSTVHDTILDTTVTLTTSWQRFTKTFDVGSLSGMTTPTANSLIYIAIRQSQSDSGTAAWELNLTGMQLEVGTEATPFEHRSFGQELALCQRYFQMTNAFAHFAGRGTGTTTAVASLPLTVPMRASPTLSTNSISTRGYTSAAIDVSSATHTVQSYSANDNLLSLSLSGFDNLLDDRVINFQITGSANGATGWSIDAEL